MQGPLNLGLSPPLLCFLKLQRTLKCNLSVIIFDLSNAVLNIEGSRIILSVDEEISFDDASWLRHFYFGCGLLLFEPASWLISPNCPGFAEIQKGNWVMRILAGNKLSCFFLFHAVARGSVRI